ncbi:MAG: ROK family protein [Bacteroidota bacterium]
METYIGIDIGGTRIKIGAIINDELMDSKIVDVESKNKFESMIESVEVAIDEICANLNISAKEVAGIGVTFPGIVDAKQSKVIATNDKYDSAKAFDWKKWVAEKYNNCSFYINNDAKLAAVGEWKYGAGRGTTDMAMITLGTGVGSGVISDNRMLGGKHGQAGNLGGHLTVKFDGDTCSCGNKGCIEAQASTDVLERLYKEYSEGKDSSLAKEEKVDFKAIFTHAAEGDLVASELRDYCMNVWGAGVVNHIHAYDPEVVVLGGGIMNSKDVILPHIKGYVDAYAWTPWNDVKIVEASMLDNAAVFGAVYMCKNQ